MKVLLIVPAYNEALNIEKTIKDIKDNTDYDYVIINDCSKDNTKEILDGIFYMLSLKPCNAKDFVETLSFPDKDIYNMLSYLTDEGFIRLQDGVYYSK